MYPSIASDMSPYDIAFFHDFILFLERLKNKPIKRTRTGAISLTDIADLLKEFKTQERQEEYKKYGWHLHREDELDFLTQVRIITEAIFLTYKRKGLLLLSKNGLGFLNNLDINNQYKQMVLHYWYRVNWEYFTPSISINNASLAEHLQYHQNTIWQQLLEFGRDWIDYREFCHSLDVSLALKPFISQEYDPEYDLLFEVSLILFKRNLCRFGCVEIEEKSFKYEWHKEITRFRSTGFGLEVYTKALFENFL